jgi:hypothetical protein
MYTKRLKITAENYEQLRTVAGLLPKHAKGNDSVREALNISAGTWHYLRKSNDFKDFKNLRAQHNDARVVVKKGEWTKIPKSDGIITLDAPQPHHANQIVPGLDARAICASIDKNTAAILKLVEAWQNKPATIAAGKKPWFTS